MTLYRGGGHASGMKPPAKLPKVEPGPAPGSRRMPPGPLARYSLVDETVTVDGVVYDVAKIRALVLERHQLADDLRQARGEIECWDLAYDALEQRRRDDLEGLVMELALATDTLRLRSEALNRVATENERLRAAPVMEPPPDTSWVKTECVCCPGEPGGVHVGRWRKLKRWAGV